MVIAAARCTLDVQPLYRRNVSRMDHGPVVLEPSSPLAPEAAALISELNAYLTVSTTPTTTTSGWMPMK
jgi:hypothetical protein